MKNFGILILGVSIFASVSCGRSKRVADEPMDGAVISEAEEVSPVEVEEPKKKRKSRWGRKREQEQPVAEGGEAGLEEGGAANPETREADQPNKKQKELVDSASEALAAAKVHIELGDYDFAGDELRKISPGSPLYLEAQRLLEAYR